MDLFVYGTLMDDDLVVQLTGHRFRKDAAVLDGYRKLVAFQEYPQILPSPGSRVDGFVLRGVSEHALQALDRYEGEGRLYKRTNVVVEINGRKALAMTYVGIPSVPKNCA